MSRAKRDDMVLIDLGLTVLLESVRQTEIWWRVQGNDEALRRARDLGYAIRLTHTKFFGEADRSDDEFLKARFIADGLREAARQCHEGQAALQERLLSGAVAIERLCRARGERS